jgi:HSP20 family protein
MPDIKVRTENTGAVTHRPETYFPTFPLGGLFGASPFRLMKRFTEEMDRAFGGFATPAEPEFWAPALEIKTTDSNFVVTAELPGLSTDEIKVEVVDEALVIEGERKRQTEEKREEFYRSERYYGKFYRSIPLPKGANTEAVKAELNNGVLQVTVPVPELTPAARQVPIGTGAR